MSKIDFRTGALTGRLGGMVGATWKGIDYVRKMVTPFNPKSAAQTGTRDVFAFLVEKGRRINSTILKDNIVPKPKKMSPFNKFLQNNQPMIDAGAVTIADMVIAKGGLFEPPNVVLTVGGDTDDVVVAWDADLEGEAEDSDNVLIVVWNETKDLYAFETSKTRVDATATIAITEDSADVIHAWLFVKKGVLFTSDTAYDTGVVS